MNTKQIRSELEKLTEEYKNILDKLYIQKAGGDLAKLCNYRDQFDETFDQFFDSKELRVKYEGAWDEEENVMNTDINNSDLLEMLNDEDLKDLCNFYRNYIARLEDELVA